MLSEETLNASAVPTGERHVLKSGNTFALVDGRGDMFDLARSELGLYFRGTRHLSRLSFAVDGVPLLPLGSGTGPGGELIQESMNERFVLPGDQHLPRGVLYFRRTTALAEGALSQRVEVTSYAQVPVTLVLRFGLAADYSDLFEVRGARRAARGTTVPTRAELGTLTFGYQGLDHLLRRTRVTLRPAATSDGDEWVASEIDLHPGRSHVVDLTVQCLQTPVAHFDAEPDARPAPPPDLSEIGAARRAGDRSWDERSGRIELDPGRLSPWFAQSWADLRLMTVETEHGSIVHAGVPWFSTLFGRDALWTALSVGWLQPDLMRGVLAALAESQALDWDKSRDAEPGKIVHELREGEMANLFEVPFGRYYGSVDSTPLFLVLLAEYLAATDDVVTVLGLLPAARRAWNWLGEFGDRDGDGFVEYERHSPQGLLQQGWKDSHDSVAHEDGAPAVGPIALCEVQGYAYAAHRAMAQVLHRLGEIRAASEIEASADRLRSQFDEAFWCEDIGMYALALDGDKRPCRQRTSNVGHVLWSGIALQKRHSALSRALSEPDLRSGFGLRTLSSAATTYNPLSYHNGSVWPHDTAIAVAGLARIGAHQEALALYDELAHLAARVERGRLPELICGFARGDDDRPTLYPVACSPQAWASAACFLGLRALIGIELDGRSGSVLFRSPHLPSRADRLRIMRLPVGHQRIDVMLERDGAELRIESSGRGTVTLVEPPSSHALNE